MSDSTSREKILFGHAVAQSAAGRVAYLEQACGDDAALRARVEALLRAHDESRHPPDAAPGEAVPTAEAVPPPAESTGVSIGRYQVRQKIGEGACGVVYRAEQGEPVRRSVALKVVKLGMVTRDITARFEAERPALASMDHPNIARLLDAGTTGTGQPYFAMELVQGPRITDYCDQHNLSLSERLELFNQVCRAVQYAHGQGVIHGDLKPTNILVSVPHGAPVAKVLDFGIAHATKGRFTDRRLFAALEQFDGAPAYLSPEQAEMNGPDIDPRCDIYNLGVLLYELLTGQPPFDSKTLILAGPEEMYRQIREVNPPRPSARLRSLDKQMLATTAQRRQTEPANLISLVQGDLDRIVMRCLKKDPRRRYQTADELARELERRRHDEPIAALPPQEVSWVEKLSRRNPFAFPSGGIVGVVLVVGLGVATLMYIRELAARRRAVTAEQTQALLRRQAEAAQGKADAEAGKSRHVAQFLAGMLQDIAPSVALGRDTTLLQEILDKTAERVGNELRDQPEVEADLRMVIGQDQRALGQYDKAEAMFRESLAIRRKFFGNEHLAVADTLFALGGLLDERGRFPEADAAAAECLAIRTKVLGAETTEVANTAYGIATLRMNRGDFAGAEPFALRALAIRRKLLGNEHPDVADALGDSGYCMIMRGEFAEGEARIREALGIYRKAYGDGHPKVADTLGQLGAAYFLHGDYAKAEPLFREALAAQRRVFASDNPDADLANSLTGLAACLAKRGENAAAEPLWREALAIQREKHGERHPMTITALTGLAGALQQRREYSGAEALLLDAGKIVKTASFVAPDLVHDTVEGLASLYAAWARTDPAKANLAAGWQRQLEELQQASPEPAKTGPAKAPDER